MRRQSLCRAHEQLDVNSYMHATHVYMSCKHHVLCYTINTSPTLHHCAPGLALTRCLHEIMVARALGTPIPVHQRHPSPVGQPVRIQMMHAPCVPPPDWQVVLHSRL